MILNLVFYTLIMISHSFWLTVISIFFTGAFTTIRIGIGYTYMVELVGAPYRTIYGTIWNINEGLIYLLATIYFW